jgi:hypothetical protein
MPRLPGFQVAHAAVIVLLGLVLGSAAGHGQIVTVWTFTLLISALSLGSYVAGLMARSSHT